MAKSTIRAAFEVNPHFKQAFAAGMCFGAKLERQGSDPTLMAAVDQVGSRVFIHLFTNDISEPGALSEAETFFDDYWNNIVSVTAKGG